MDDLFKVDNLSLIAQRHVFPVYRKDGRGGYEFSSTVTFLKYDDRYFCVFAAHALCESETELNNIGFLVPTCSFIPFSSIAINFKIDRLNDVVVFETIQPISNKNYFNLNLQINNNGKYTEYLYWIGFPSKKSVKAFDLSKVKAGAIEKYIEYDCKGQTKFTNAKFLIIEFEFNFKDNKKITGTFCNKNVTYQIDGFKQNGYSLQGMSGGAIYRTSKMAKLDKSYNDINYYFEGIGIEFRKKQIIGVERNIIINNINTLISESKKYT